MATGDQADTFYIDPIDERTVTKVLIRDAPIWARLPDEDQATSARTARRQDVDALVTQLYLSEYRSLVRLAALLIHDVPTAEEVVQDAFVSMSAGWGRLRNPDMALPYLRQAVVNRSRSVLRHRTVVEKHAPKHVPDEPSAEAGAITLLERSAVVAALRRLPGPQREAIVLRYYADLSEAEIAAAMSISRGAVKSHTTRGMATLRSALEREIEQPEAESDYRTLATVVLPVSIYLAEESIHAQVEAAVEEWLALAEVAIEKRESPIIGSWFRRMTASAKVALRSEAAQELTLTAVHAADARIVLAQDATITATLLANLGPVIASLQPTKDAVLRVGALLIVKVDWVVQVIQLTAAQQAILDHQPHLVSDPHQIVAALQLSPPTAERVTSPADLSRP